MTFSLIPVYRTYLAEDQVTPRTGTVRLQLTGPMANGGEIAGLQPIVLTLDGAGHIETPVWATDDPDTQPEGGAALQVTENVSDLPQAVYLIAVPAAGGPIDLATAPRLTEAPYPARIYQDAARRGMPGGYPTLDSLGKVPLDQLPPSAGGVIVGTGPGTVAAGDDARIVGALQKTSRLSELAAPPDQAAARTNLGLGAAAVLNVGTGAGDVAAGNAVSAHVATPDAHGDRAWTTANFRTNTVLTIPELIAGNGPYYIAHRGGTLSEHTMEAYECAVALGARAIEVSARLSSEGTPVCIHDESLARTTYSTGNVSDYSYDYLRSQVLTNGKLLLGPGHKDDPIPNLVDVLDRFVGRAVIFLEGKSNPSIPVIQQLLLDRYPEAPKSVVWKNYYANLSFPWAKAHGYTTWGYVDPNTTDAQLEAVDANIDMWGVPIAMADARIQEIVARGKPVICWEVHRRSERDRLMALGVRGMMCAQYAYVTRATPFGTRDTWAEKIKGPGELGNINYDPGTALQFDTATSSVFINSTGNRSVVLGRLGPIANAATSYRIHYEMMYEGTVPSAEHAGIAFGKASDDPYRFSLVNPSGGFHTVHRGNGDMQLYRHDPGVATGIKIGEVLVGTQPPGSAPVPGQYMTFEIDVTPTTITMRRTDTDPDVVIGPITTSTDPTKNYRGGYVHLSNGSIASMSYKPHWRSPFEILPL